MTDSSPGRDFYMEGKVNGILSLLTQRWSECVDSVCVDFLTSKANLQYLKIILVLQDASVKRVDGIY